MASIYRRWVKFVTHTLSLIMPSGTENSPLSCEIPVIEPGSDYSKETDVGQWSSCLCELYQSPDQMKAKKVIQLDWYKYADGVEHEYLIATVAFGDRNLYLRIERRASDDAVVVENNALKPETIDSFPPDWRARFSKDISMEKNAVRGRRPMGSSSRRLSAKDNIPRADDTVAQYVSHKGISREHGESDVHLLASYNFSSKPLYLRDLAIILSYVNKSSAGYKLLMEQCYWFARTCVGVAKYIYNPIETQCASRWSTSGTYRRVTINKDNPPQIEEFALAVDADIRENDEYLEKKYRNGEGGRIKAEQVAEQERQRADEERRQKAQETHRAELAEKAVEQERRRADAANAEAQQLRAQLALLQTNSMSPKAQ